MRGRSLPSMLSERLFFQLTVLHCDFRSSWTDTPEQKALKAAGVPQVDQDEQAREDLKRDAELHFIAQRDREQEEAAKSVLHPKLYFTTILELSACTAARWLSVTPRQIVPQVPTTPHTLFLPSTSSPSFPQKVMT